MSRERKFHVVLTESERDTLKALCKKTTSSNARTRCIVLLNADENRKDSPNSYKSLASSSGCTEPTVIKTLRKYQEGGIMNAVRAKRNPNSNTSKLKATGEIEARVIAKAVSSAPNGYARWTLTLLTKELMFVLEDSISRSTIGRILNRNQLRPHVSAYWCLAPKEDAEFVSCMEDILDLYQQPFNPTRPLWCLDEKPYQLLGESREPIPMKKGNVAKFDSEYKRNGTVSVFLMIQPHSGRIIHFVEPTRTAVDWAEKVKYLVDVVEPDAEKIVLVQDNLNTHSIASLYKAFPPEEARRIAKRLEIHYTPKHGSWLDIAEIGINIMTRECLERRIPSIEALRKELEDWNIAYNSEPTSINWQFQNKDSRIKLRSLYPNIEKHRVAAKNTAKNKLENQKLLESVAKE